MDAGDPPGTGREAYKLLVGQRHENRNRYCFVRGDEFIGGMPARKHRAPDPHYCEKLKVQPNLTVELGTRIHGRLIDASGEPFRNSPIELRLFLTPTKQVLTTTVMTDANGIFQIDDAKPGKYRLLATQARGFQQPGVQRCASRQCELSITLRPGSTDTPESVCPVR